jgi:rare lipoprotein A
VGPSAPRAFSGAFSEFVCRCSPARCALAALLIAGVAVALSACGRDKGPKLGERVIPLGQPVPKGGGRYTVGRPYEVNGERYTPREDPEYDRTGVASWYGELFHGRHTANGEIYDMDRLSAAHPTLPLPVYVHVTNLQNGRSLVVRVNDRGPFKKNRIIDLSRRSAEILGFRHKGTAPVRVRYLRRAPINGDDGYERQYATSRGFRKYSASHGLAPALNGLVLASPPPMPDRAPRTIAMAANPAPNSQPALLAPGGAAVEEAVEATGSTILSSRSDPDPAVLEDGPRIQAASFKSWDNAERAKTQLSEIGSVEVDQVDMAGETYFRVRVGPFRDGIAAASALPLVTRAGYRGAKIVIQN